MSFQDTRIRCDQTPSWAALQQHFAQTGRHFDLRQAFAQDPQRFAQLSLHAPPIFADLSKNLIDTHALALLHALARECGLEAYRSALFAGERINHTEQRAVMHWLLRSPAAAPGVAPALQPDLAQVHSTLNAMLAYAEQVRADAAITDVVNIGIGGSDLGAADGSGGAG